MPEESGPFELLFEDGTRTTVWSVSGVLSETKKAAQLGRKLHCVKRGESVVMTGPYLCRQIKPKGNAPSGGSR